MHSEETKKITATLLVIELQVLPNIMPHLLLDDFQVLHLE